MQPLTIDIVEKFTRDAVGQTFQNMLSMALTDHEPVALTADPGGHIIGSVGFTGKATGMVYLCARASFAAVITAQMLGITVAEADEAMVSDAFGELCNIVVGSVKSRLSDGGWTCILTIPSIVRGSDMRIESAHDTQRHAFGYQVTGHHLIVRIAVKI